MLQIYDKNIFYCLLKMNEAICALTEAEDVQVYVIIDPGSSCAIRVVKLYPDKSRKSWQYLIRTDLMAKGMPDKCSCLAHFISTIPNFLKADFYFVEEQFKANVIIQLGSLIGIISTLRLNDVEIIDGKRSGKKLRELPYKIVTMNTKAKTQILNEFTRKESGDIKERSVMAARRILKRYLEDSINTHDSIVDAVELLKEERKKIDDIADVICYDQYIYSKITE